MTNMIKIKKNNYIQSKIMESSNLSSILISDNILLESEETNERIIQVITNQWIDIIILNRSTNIAKRNINNDSGSYVIENEKLIITWNLWGMETFYKINDIYYNCINNIFEVKLENNEWSDIGIFNIEKSIIKRKHYDNEYGTYTFYKNDLIINWNNYGTERFYQLEYGKIYSNTKFANNIKNSTNKEIKNIAIVFPQYHEIPENNIFWGSGFTEWTLLKKIPNIVNNEIIKKPHDDIGYFNLNDYEHRKYMKILANKYNIYGFCYYHYWFKNKKIMYEPLEKMLIDGEPNKPFLFCWANEQWTKKWDGGNNEILLDQDYSNEDGNINHFNYLLQFFKHKNYIKKNNCPIFIFYRIEEKDITHIENIIKLWNELSKKEGFNGIYFMRFLGPFNNNIEINGINGYIEFEPGYITQKYYNEIVTYDENSIFDSNNNNYNEELYLKKNIDIKEKVLNGIFKSGKEHYDLICEYEKKIRTSKFFIYDGVKTFEKIISNERKYKEQHKGIFTSWNNIPRRNYSSDEYSKYPHYYKNITPKIFGQTLKKLYKKIIDDPNKDSDDFVFISAWNEWNEQAILEPNNYDGYENLIELNNAYINLYNISFNKNILIISHKGGGTEKYINDIKRIFTEYNFIDFDIYNKNINYNNLYNKEFDIIHINSILFNNLKDNYIYFFENFFINNKKYITIHDYQWLYPNDPNIIENDFYISKPNQKTLDDFIKLLNIVSIIIFPTNNIYLNYKKHINFEKIMDKVYIVNHMDKLIIHDLLYIPKITNNINISFVGRFVKYKGSEIFKLLINKYAFFENYNIIYHIFGNIDERENNISLLDNTNLIMHNEYDDNKIIDDLHKYNIHGITHLSLFEESYCYALTNSINSGIPIFYFNKGSIGERLPKKDKYFTCNINNFNNIFELFLQYIIKNNNNYNFYKCSQIVQPNRWYLSNY